MVAQSLLIEYLLDPDLQKRVKTRIRQGFNRKNKGRLIFYFESVRYVFTIV